MMVSILHECYQQLYVILCTIMGVCWWRGVVHGERLGSVVQLYACLGVASVLVQRV